MKKHMDENNAYKVIQEKLGAWMSEGQAQFTKDSDGDLGILFIQGVLNSRIVNIL